MSLEQKIYESEQEKTGFWQALKRLSAWDWVKALAFNASGAVLSGGIFGYGTINVLTTTASFLTANYLVNRKRGFTKNSVQTDIMLGAVYTPLIYRLLGAVDVYASNPLLWMAGYALSMIPFTHLTNTINYAIEKYSPYKLIKGILRADLLKDVGYVAKNTWNWLKSGVKSSVYLTVPVAMSRYLLPRELLIASLFPLRTAYRYIIGRQSENRTYAHAIQAN